MQTIGIEDVRKLHTEGGITDADVNELLDGAVQKLKCDEDISPQVTLSRVIDWRSPRFNKKVHDLFSLAVEIGRVEKAAPRPKAIPDKGDGEPDADDKGSTLERMISAHMKATGLSRPKATAAVMATPEAAAAYREERKARIGV